MSLAFTPDLSFQLLLSSQNANIRSRLQDVSLETTTGRTADPLTASGGQLGKALSLGSAVSDIDRHIQAASLSGARLDGASASIVSMRDNLSGFSISGQLTVAQGNPTAITIVQADAEALLNNVVGGLNTRIGQRHIFGGQATNSSPLANADTLLADIDAIVAAAPDVETALANVDTFFSDADGGFQTNIFKGSEADGPRLHISDTRSLSPLPKADDPVFKNLLKGLTLVASARNAGSDEEAAALMNAGFDVLGSGTDELLTLEGTLGAAQGNLDVVKTNLNAERGFLAAAENDLLSVDIFNAATELQALEGQLQASYTVTGRLGALSLVDFLR